MAVIGMVGCGKLNLLLYNRSMPMLRVCQYCSKEFVVKPSLVARGAGKYCSYSCSGKARGYTPHLNQANLLRQRIPRKGKLVCNKCGNSYLVEEFSKDSTRKGGVGSICKWCASLKSLDYHYRNREKINTFRRSEDYKKYFRPYQNAWLKKKRAESLDFRIRRNLRHRLYRALKGLRKEEKTMELIGLSLPEFKKYIESKFKEGMTWSNYGQPGWEIDHIKPCALFDLTNAEERRLCFNYTNLQPLWGIENATKKHKYEEKKCV